MLDREKVEAILAKRFPGAAATQLAAAVNAIIGLVAHQSSRRRSAQVGSRPFRAPTNAFTTVSVSTWIAAPIKRVFDLFTDVEHAPEHVSGIASVDMLTAGPFGLGTRWRESRRILGRLDTADMEITAFERYHTYTISHHKGGVKIDTVFSFEPTADGTQVIIEFALDGAGLPPGFLTPVNWAIAGKVRHVLNQDLADLKTCLERSWPDLAHA